MANAIINPDVFKENRVTIVSEPFLLLEGTLQDPQGAVSVKVARVKALPLGRAAPESHDFH